MSIESKARRLIITTLGVVSVATAACFGPNTPPVTTPVRPELAPPDWSRRSYSAPFATPVRPELASSEWISANYQTSAFFEVSEEQVSK